MTARTIFALAVLMLCQPAMSQLVTVVDAIETSPANIILPANTNGMMTFRPCGGDCDAEYKRVRLTNGTTFTVEGKAVKFSDFRREFAAIKRAELSYALVSYDTETNTVTSIDLAR